MQRLVVLYGPAACGKLTIAKALAAITGDALFHNHLTVDLLSSVFEFGSPEFIRFRTTIWLSVMTEAIRTGRAVIFTFHPEASVPSDFPALLQTAVQALGASVVFVKVTCDEREIRNRIHSPSRTGAKLNDLAFYDRLKAQGAFEYPPLPAGFTVDSTVTPPEENARLIAGWLASTSA